MKKKLLSICALVAITFGAQAQSPDWSTIQNTNFSQVSAGIRYMDAVDANVIWATGLKRILYVVLAT